MSNNPKTVDFTCMKDGTKEEYNLMAEEYKAFCNAEKLADRALSMLEAQRGIYGGARVDLMEHGLQCATRALKDGAEEEIVVIALLHDIGEHLSPCNHGDIPAGILKPYISEKAWWILAHHEVFQGFYYFHLVGGDKNKRDIWKDHPYYQATVDFCEKYDQSSFDPEYKSMQLEDFRPMVINIFSREPFSHDPTNPKAVAVYGKED